MQCSTRKRAIDWLVRGKLCNGLNKQYRQAAEAIYIANLGSFIGKSENGSLNFANDYTEMFYQEEALAEL